MTDNVPYMISVKNLQKILDAIQRAGVPEVFNFDFLKDLGYKSSNDRAIIKILKYIGMLDASGHPQTAYREFMDNTKARGVLASRLHNAYDDLFLSDKQAHSKSTASLKGWFKTKTGAGEATAMKMATTFKNLASYADFSKLPVIQLPPVTEPPEKEPLPLLPSRPDRVAETGFGLVYRFEIHLPDTQNVDTFRAIFRALREELML